MAIRTFAYSPAEYGESGSYPHGAVFKNSLESAVSSAYPDRGNSALTGDNTAYPLVMTDNYMICARSSRYPPGGPRGVVYAAPLRNTFTYFRNPTNNSIGVKSFLVSDGASASSADTHTPDASINTTSPIAMFLIGDSAVVSWGYNLSIAGFVSISIVGGASKHYAVNYPGSGGACRPRAIGIKANGDILVVFSNTLGIWITPPLSQALFGTGQTAVNMTGPYTHNALRVAVASMALVHSFAGDDLVKVVAARDIREETGDGPGLAASAQWLGQPLGAGMLRVHGAAPRSAIDELPSAEYTSTGGLLTSSLMAGDLAYSVASSAITISSFTLPTEIWNAGPDIGSRWLADPFSLPGIIGIDADSQPPVKPLFWSNIISAREQL